MVDSISTLDGAKEQIVAALDEAIVALKVRVSKPYSFRFVSQQQALPIVTAYAKWATPGQTGLQPTATAAELRAAIYDQARPASELAAFLRVSNVSALELAQTAVEGFMAGQVIVPYSVLRSFIERTAHAAALADVLKALPTTTTPLDVPLKPLLELSGNIRKALYGTQRDWPELAKVDFRRASPKEVAYVAKEDVADLKASNVLTAVDKLEKRVPGSRLTYEILCEFLHPNIGDLMGTTLAANSFVDMHGTRHLVRIIGLGPKNLAGLPEQRVITTKLLDVCSDIVRHVPRVLDEIESVSISASEMTRKFAHMVAKRHRHWFANRDLCPCLSGLNVRDCTRRYKDR